MQGTCGSCWAFSTTGAIEGASFVATGTLCEKQLVDCDHEGDAKKKNECDNGCSGGLTTNAYKYLMDAGGLQEESTYPYTGKKGECKFDKRKVAVNLVNFTTIPIDEDLIASTLVRHGPLAVGLNAVFMQTYIGGVLCPTPVDLREAVAEPRRVAGRVRVAYGYSILRVGYKPYWLIYNSWGEDGYYKLCCGHGMCGMNTMVSAVSACLIAP